MTEVTDLTSSVDLTLNDGTLIKVETSIRGREDVAFSTYSLQEISGTVESLAESLYGMLKKSKATKSTIKFGIEIGVESGQLTALLVKGSSKGNLEITLEWDNLT